MSTPEHPTSSKLDRFGAFKRWQNKRVASPAFQSWASRFPLTRRIARKDGEKLFDLVAGFVYSQTLFAIVELDILQKLFDRAMSAERLAHSCGTSANSMETLCKSAAAIGLLHRSKDGEYSVARLGAAMLGVPGLMDMVRHHDILYRDMADPVALLRNQKDTELAAFWPYVLGQGELTPDPATVARYSDLMAQSQHIVAEETMRQVSFKGITTLMDVGGGTGAFLRAIGESYPNIERIVFDLPDVVAGLTEMPAIGGSFLEALPGKADAISLIRVLYDHSDETITTLLENVHDALPAGGSLIISEPMSGGDTPCRATDGYFAFYTMAMRTGQVRSQAQIGDLLRQIGFADVKTPVSARPYVTSVVTANKPV